MGRERPKRIGRFELQHEFGRGAQAVVWLAHERRLELALLRTLRNQGVMAFKQAS